MSNDIKEESDREKQAFLLYLKPDLKIRLQHIANKRGLSMTGIITNALWEWLSKQGGDI